MERLRKTLIKTSYILFSLVISIALWMFFEINENDLQTRDIPVSDIVLKNVELLNSRGLLVSSILTENLTLTFEGPRVDISRLAAGEVTVEVDLENIRTAGTAPLSYVEILPASVNQNNVSIIGASSSQVILLIDRLLSREFPIEVIYTGGTASDEFIAETPVVEPRVMTISGPEEIVSQISHVTVPIAAENLSTSYTDELGFILINQSDEIIGEDSYVYDTLTFSYDTVRVTIPIRQLKSIPLQVTLSHGKATTDSNVTWSATPTEILVSGDPDVIRDLNSIVLGTVDMTSFGLQRPIDFPIILPDNLMNISGESTATVLVEVLGGQIMGYRSVSNFSVENVPPGYSATIQTQAQDVRLRGTPQNLNLITSSNILITADLTDLSTGTSRVNARAHIVGIEIEADIIGEYWLVVTITDDSGS